MSTIWRTPVALPTAVGLYVRFIEQEPPAATLDPQLFVCENEPFVPLITLALIPVSILAIRLSQRFIHPIAFDKGGPNMAGSQFFTFCVAVLAMFAVAATLYHLELAGKRLDVRLRELREALQ